MRSFVVFLVCGGLAAGINLVVRWILSHWLPYEVSISLAFLGGLLSGFLLFKYVAFDSGKSKRIFRETFWYIIINVCALLQTLVISVGLADHLFPRMGMSFYPYDTAHVIGVMVPVATSFLGHKYFTFRKE